MVFKTSLLPLIFAMIAVAVVILDRIMSRAAPPKQKTWLTDYKYAHRGLHNAVFPENSLPAYRKAIEHGFAIELDVHLSKDGRIVVFHDKDLKRMTGTEGCVKDFTYEQLRQLRLNGTQYGIPTLDETLDLIGGQVPILVEIKKKGFAGELERRLYARMEQYEGKYAVQSFSPFSIRWFKKNAPHIFRGQLSCNFSFCKEDFPRMSAVLRFFVTKLLWIVQRLNVNFICKPNFISYEFHKVNTRLIRRLRKSGAPIFAWTVRNKEQYELAKPYTDSVIFEDFTPDMRRYYR